MLFLLIIFVVILQTKIKITIIYVLINPKQKYNNTNYCGQIILIQNLAKNCGKLKDENV
jgi:hypothetical protein